MNFTELGEKAYQLCIEKGWEPREYIDGLRSPAIIQIAKQFYDKIKAEGLTGSEQPFVEEEIDLLVGAIGDAAQKAGDIETASYVASLVNREAGDAR